MRPRKVGSIFAALLAVVLSLFLAASMYSQVMGATLSGTISDPSVGVIPGAEITITNTATGIKKGLADSVGYYAAPNLIPGTYAVRVAATGFNTVVSSVSLEVGAQQQLNIAIKVGETSQTIQVTLTAPQIDLTSSTLDGQVESQTILELPVNGRDWTSLTALHPGVNLIETQMDYSGSARGNRGLGAELTISGPSTTNNNDRLDGVSVNDYANSGPGNVIGAALGVDAIREFSVLTGGSSAKYGKASGGVVNAITKSGTNSFHSDVYKFIRNSAFDSRDYFSRSGNAPLAQFRRSQFGAAAGGPIIKDKTFIFGDYEGFRQAQGITTTVTVPSDSARAGNLVSGLATVDPAAAMELAMFPHATPGTSVGDKGKFINAALQIVPEHFYTVRVDHKLSTNDILFGTYLFADTDFKQPDSFNNVILDSHTRRQTVVLEQSHTISPNLLNTARIGFSRDHALNLVAFGAINPAAARTSLGSMTGHNGAGIFDETGAVIANGIYGHFGDTAWRRSVWTAGDLVVSRTIEFAGLKIITKSRSRNEESRTVVRSCFVRIAWGCCVGRSRELSPD